MLARLEGTQFSALIRTELWGWPLALTLHALGTAVVIGFVLIICLRLLGLFETIPRPSLNRLFSVTWFAMAVQFLTGFALWATKPTRYVADGAFVLKLLLVIVGAALLLYFQQAVRRDAAKAAVPVSSGRTTLVAATLLVWCGALVASRLTAYLGTIYTG